MVNKKLLTNTNTKELDEIYYRIARKKLDQMEKKYNITSSEIHIPNKLSTGLLSVDLITGGGIASGAQYQISGQEKSGKSTLGLNVTGCAIRKKIPIIEDWDVENAVNDPIYAQACLGVPIRESFYGPNKVARLYTESILEDFYDTTKYIMNSMPDKMYRTDLEQWFFVFDSDKLGRFKMGEFGISKYDKGLYGSTGRLWCETDILGMQGIIICDSYPALLTLKMDEEDETKILPAQQARAFSDNIRKIVGIMKRKGFSVFGVNQIRVNPMPKFGQNPMYEPCGNALAFYSSCRLQSMYRAVPKDMFPGIGPSGYKTNAFGQEPSVYGKGLDKYNYVMMTNTKNKLGTPGLQAMMRIWFKDGYGDPHGFDIVYDTYQYLRMTGRIDGSPRKGIKIKLPEFNNWPRFNWEEFKLLILANTDTLIMKRAKEIFKKTIPTFRTKLFNEIRTREAYKILIDDAKERVEEDLEA
jgi:RecA/RadA recombinase